MAEISFPAGERTLVGLWDPAGDPIAVAVVAHGAGNDMRHELFTGIAGSLVQADISCLRFNFPYAQLGRRSPDRPPVLVESWRAALAEAGRRAGEIPVVASGKSLGGRMASLVAAEEEEGFAGAALVFFGYPLHAPGKPDTLRSDHLSSVRVPMLFVQGTADPLATYSMIEDLVKRLEPLASLHPVEGGDHSFRVRGRGRPAVEIGEGVGTVAATFIREVVGA